MGNMVKGVLINTTDVQRSPLQGEELSPSGVSPDIEVPREEMTLPRGRAAPGRPHLHTRLLHTALRPSVRVVSAQ